MTIIFDDNDESFLAWMNSHPGGFVVNTRRNISPDYMVLHRAGCHHISVYSPTWEKGGFTERQYIKICAPTVGELSGWAQAHGSRNGKFSKHCQTCNPFVPAL